MNHRQRRFVEEYLVDLNGTQAAIRAGYSAGSADVTAARLLGKASVQLAISEAQRARQQRTEITADNVLRELATLGFSDVGQILDFSGVEPRLRPANEIPEQARRCIASVKVRRYLEGQGEYAREVEVTEFKLWNKIQPLVKLAQHLGLLTERHEIRVASDDDIDRAIEEELRRLGAGGSGPSAGSAAVPVTGDGPYPDPEPGRTEAGPVAGGGAGRPVEGPPPAPLFETGGQVDHGSGPGVEAGHP